MSELIAVVKDNYRDPFRANPFVPEKEAKNFFNDIDLCLEADFKERDLVEGNMLFVQLVSYTIIMNPVKRMIFVAQRVSGEGRLQDKYCIGFGGHVNINDFQVDKEVVPNPIYVSAVRELREELNIKNKRLDLKHLGYIRDLESSTPDHIGSVYYLTSGAVSVKEKDTLANAKWVTFDEFKKNYYFKLESWSRYIFDYIYESKDFAGYCNTDEGDD